MNPFQRLRVCETQISADDRFGNTPIGGVVVKDEHGEYIRVNSTPKTNWRAEKMKAQEQCHDITASLPKCWFCEIQDKSLVFDTEFDTHVHIQCIISALQKDPNDPEAKMMRYLIYQT